MCFGLGLLQKQGFGARRHLGLDTRLVFRAGVKLQGPLPLEARFGLAAHLPIGIAEMVVQERGARRQFNGPFEEARGQFIAAHPVMRPAETVDDIA